MTILPATTARDLAVVRELFTEYAGSLEIDLCFQGFAAELASLPGKYAPAAGRLFLASESGQIAGCVALRPIADGICEMKRLYVRPAFRGCGIGAALAEAVITAAKEIGYTRMRLDTLSSMTLAIRVYEKLGFRRIDPYYENPSGLAVFFELALNPESSRQSRAAV